MVQVNLKPRIINLLKESGDLTTSQVSEILDVHKPTVTQYLKHLVRDGQIHVHDKRKNYSSNSRNRSEVNVYRYGPSPEASKSKTEVPEDGTSELIRTMNAMVVSSVQERRTSSED